MPLAAAGQAEIIRANQKDVFYLSYLRTTLAEIVQRIFGARAWLSWRSEVDLVSDLSYFMLTTWSGYQTLGEEYVNVVQVDSTKRAVPSKLRHLSMILLHVGGWYGLRKLLDLLERRLRTGGFQDLPEQSRAFLLRCIPVILRTMTVLQRFHLAVFYLQGTFYHLAKRLLGVSYLQFNMHPELPSNRPSFRLLGWLSVTQIAASLALEAFSQLQRLLLDKGDNRIEARPDDTRNESSKETVYVPQWKRCSLCLEERKACTATPCGHLFCWNCIHEWCRTKVECPLCRDKFAPSRLVFLQNYS